MTPIGLTVRELLRQAGIDPDRDLLARVAELVAEVTRSREMAQQIGAAKQARTPTRQTQRNCDRELSLATRAGDPPLRIPKQRTAGSCHLPCAVPPALALEAVATGGVLQSGVDDDSGGRSPKTVNALRHPKKLAVGAKA